MPTIFTHSLQHHADEVMACAILSMLYPEMKIVRTQDLSKAGPDDYVVDTGMVYDPKPTALITTRARIYPLPACSYGSTKA
jgi:uncharacterized UPF0160 family protein